MIWFLGQILLVAGLFIGTSLTGLATMQLWGPAFLKHRSVERTALAPIVGTAVWVILFGFLSHMGFRAGTATGIVLGTALLAISYTWSADGRPVIWHPRLIWLGCYSMLAVGICLLPIALYDIFYPMNDSLGAYITLSDWLQRNGYSHTAGSNPSDIIEAVARLYQHMHYRLGSTFFLALVQATSGASQALTVFPAVMAWGFLLLSLSLFVFARWSLHLRVNVAVMIVAYIAIGMTPIRWAATNGFLAQMYGTAGLLTAGAFMARMVQRSTWSLRGGWYLGVASAFLLSVYSEMFPVLGLSFFVYLVVVTRHALRHSATRKLATMLAVTVISFVAISNVELVRGYHAIQSQLGLTNGWHIPLAATEFWAAAMGQHYFMSYLIQEAADFPTKWAKGASLLSIPMTILFLIGLPYMIRRDRSRLALAIFSILVMLFWKFGLMSRNPWTGAQANTYIVFKTIQWIFPIIAVVQVIGLQVVVRSLRSVVGFRTLEGNALSTGFLCLVAMMWVPVHIHDAKMAWASLAAITDSATPFRTLTQLGQAIDAQQYNKLYMVRPEPNPWPYLMYAYFLHPRPLEADWRGVDYLAQDSQRDQHLNEPIGRTSYLLIGSPLLGERGAPFPANVTVLGSGPSVIYVSNQNGVELGPRGPVLWLGDNPASLIIFSAQRRLIRIKMLVPTEPTTTEASKRRIAVSPREEFMEVRPIGPHLDMLEIALTVNPTLTTLSLSSQGRPTLGMLMNGDTRPLPVKVEMVALE